MCGGAICRSDGQEQKLIQSNTLNLQMLYRQLLDQQVASPTTSNSGAKSPLTKAFARLAPFLDQTLCTYELFVSSVK